MGVLTTHCSSSVLSALKRRPQAAHGQCAHTAHTAQASCHDPRSTICAWIVLQATIRTTLTVRTTQWHCLHELSTHVTTATSNEQWQITTHVYRVATKVRRPQNDLVLEVGK